MTSAVEWLWYGSGYLQAGVRGVLLPMAAMYRSAVALRNGLYDKGILRVEQPSLPVLSVGNLTAGGSGKTPFAAWLAARLLAAGAKPAVVLRGYGGDEELVHRELNPGAVVVTGAKRVHGVSRALELGCDVVVLDDGFQHRRLGRLADLVLLSAERWQEPQRLLPAGPWREPLRALERAALLVVSRRTHPREEAEALAARLGRVHRVASATIALLPGELRSAFTRQALPLGVLRAKPVLAVAGIADPRSFGLQLERTGALVELAGFPDHHRFSRGDVRRLVQRAQGAEFCVCTQKDAVKLRLLWPRDAPALWYVSMRCEVESGTEALEAILARALALRHPAKPNNRPADAGAST
ncbi:MAG TPA: tetraacyldisaccharide 4'-kinase [Gemmatimonadaceae bacterium]|nr:tetraacyldisaccharide 4'-kinase [Gemmatimonadaceae bacterium]